MAQTDVTNMEYAEALARCTGAREVTVVDEGRGEPATYTLPQPTAEQDAIERFSRVVDGGVAAVPVVADEQVWYELECSVTGADDWFRYNAAESDTEEGIRRLLADHKRVRAGSTFEYRAVRKVLRTEVLNG